MKRKRNRSVIPAVIPSAGMRRDATRRDTNAAIPDEESVNEEIVWRMEHRQ